MPLENFKELERVELKELEPQLQLFDERHSQAILNNVWGSLSFIRMVGDVADVYLSKILDVFLEASTGPMSDNGGIEEDSSRRKNDPPSDGPVAPPGRKGPEQP